MTRIISVIFFAYYYNILEVKILPHLPNLFLKYSDSMIDIIKLIKTFCSRTVQDRGQRVFFTLLYRLGYRFS